MGRLGLTALILSALGLFLGVPILVVTAVTFTGIKLRDLPLYSARMASFLNLSAARLSHSPSITTRRPTTRTAPTRAYIARRRDL